MIANNNTIEEGNNMKKVILLILVLISGSLSGCLSSDEEELDEFPSFSLVDEQGNEHKNSMRDKYGRQLVSVWAPLSYGRRWDSVEDVED